MRRVLGYAAILAMTATVGACASSNVGAASTTPSSPTPTATCAAQLTPATLPPWARDGFSQPTQPVKYVLGDKGQFLAVVFGDPLRAPNPAGHGNKILWVVKPVTFPHASNSGSSDNLLIHATLVGTSESVERVVPGGPGPSLIDLPKPGCWSLDLNWSGLTDHLALLYR